MQSLYAYGDATETCCDESLRNHGLVIDSLQFVDSELDNDEMREKIDNMILETMRDMPFDPDFYLKRVPNANPTFSALIENSLEKVANDEPTQPLSFNHTPVAPSPDAGSEVWKDACKNLFIATEASVLEAINLELAAEYSVDAWKKAVQNADSVLQVTRNRVARLKKQLDEINTVRSDEQNLKASRISQLKRKYQTIMNDNLQVQFAVLDAEKNLKRLRSIAASKGISVGPSVSSASVINTPSDVSASNFQGVASFASLLN